MTELAVETRGLTKSFGKTKAVAGVDLSIKAGSIYAVLGPNGAGKTTTLRMLATLLPPDGGEARVFGHDVVKEADAVRSQVSLTGQFASVDEELTGRENLILLARLLGFRPGEARERADTLLAAFDLSEAARRQVKTYSGGMRRRLDIAASLVVAPALLFLDEPTTGLDPRSRNQVWDIARALRDAGTTLLLTTQYLEEADQLAERIAVIDQGKVIAEGTPRELKASVGSNTLRLKLRETGRVAEARENLERFLGGEAREEGEPGNLVVRVSDPSRASEALGELSRAGILLEEFTLGAPSLDEVFLTLTGHRPGEEEARSNSVLPSNPSR